MHTNRPGLTPLFDADDLLLFSESPFAFWMERCRFEGGESGPVPDPEAPPREPTLISQARLRESLPGDTRVIPWGASESERRLATLEAMRAGVDWIIDGQLAHGLFSTPVNLLRRDISGQGMVLYQPCLTQVLPHRSARLHLYLLADLLEQLQGHSVDELLLLQNGRVDQVWSTEEWMPLFRAFRDHFLSVQSSFDVDFPPDPGLSLDHGRWSNHALAHVRKRNGSDIRSSDPTASHTPTEQPKTKAEHPAQNPAVYSTLECHPLDTPGFSVLRSRRPRRRETPEVPPGSVLNTRDALGE